MPWITFLFQGLPETIASTAFCFAIIKLPLIWNLILRIGVIYGISAFSIRLLPISYGVHTIILIFILVVLLVSFTKCKLSLAFMAALTNMITVAASEFLLGALLNFLNISFQELYKNQWLWTLLGLPQVLILLSLAFILNYFNKQKTVRKDSCD